MAANAVPELPPVAVTIDGAGRLVGGTGDASVDHLLSLLAAAAGIDVAVGPWSGATDDLGIALGSALEAAAPKAGRYGSSTVPSEEALAVVAIDRGVGPYLALNVDLRSGDHGDAFAELSRGLVRGGRWTLHARLLAGRDPEHIVRAMATGIGHALRRSWASD